MIDETMEPSTQTIELEKAPFKAPWEVYIWPEDEKGFKRREYFFPNHWEMGIEELGPFGLIFKHNQDNFNWVGTLPGMLAGFHYTQSGEYRGIPEIISGDMEGVITFLKSLRDIKYHDFSDAINILSDENKRWGNILSYDILDSMVACSLYDQDGNFKKEDDNEQSALLFTWLATEKTNPTLSQQCLKELLRRREYLPGDDQKAKDKANVQKALAEKPPLGEIPFDKIIATHCTNYFPKSDDGTLFIEPRIDADGVPRNTIHTYVNGMVEEHGILDKASWEKQRYAIIMPFNKIVADPNLGLPENMLIADTYWPIKPHQGFKIPQGSVIFIPVSEKSKYNDVKGVEYVFYDPEVTLLRETIKTFFTSREIPFLEKMDPKVTNQATYTFTSLFDIRSAAHSDGDRGSFDFVAINAFKALRKAIKNIEEDSHKKVIRPETAGELWFYGSDAEIVYKPIKKSLALVLAQVRDMVADHIQRRRGNFTLDMLETLYAAHLI